MSTSTAPRESTHEGALAEEFEHEPVPLSRRHSLKSVAAVWFGFPMVLTQASSAESSRSTSGSYKARLRSLLAISSSVFMSAG